MRSKTLIAVCVFCAISFLAVSGSAGEQFTPHDLKMMNPDRVDKCMNLDHGLMMKCILEEMNKSGEAGRRVSQPVNEKKKVDWKAPRNMKRKKNPVAVDEGSLAKGKEFFTLNCTACHGVSARGDGPIATHFGKKVADLTSPVLSKVSDGELFWKIAEGGWPMPAFGHQEEWSDADLWNVINYIRTLSGREN